MACGLLRSRRRRVPALPADVWERILFWVDLTAILTPRALLRLMHALPHPSYRTRLTVLRVYRTHFHTVPLPLRPARAWHPDCVPVQVRFWCDSHVRFAARREVHPVLAGDAVEILHIGRRCVAHLHLGAHGVRLLPRSTGTLHVVSKHCVPLYTQHPLREA